MFAIVTPLGAYLSIALQKQSAFAAVHYDSTQSRPLEMDCTYSADGSVAQEVPPTGDGVVSSRGSMWRAIDVLRMSIVNVRGRGILMVTRSCGLLV